jgi:cytochrome P450
MKRVTAEIRTAFANFKDINATKAQQLPYLQAVISEGLRIFPPGSGGAPRVSPGFEVDGQYIPEGAEIYTSPWSVTHDPKHFKDPFSYQPERWLDKNSEDRREASQPFLLGPRACLGRK